MQNSHGPTVVDFWMNYWTVSNVMVKFGPTGKRQIFYLVRNYMDECIHLLIKPVLNAGFSDGWNFMYS